MNSDSIPRTMRALVYRGPNNLRLEQVPVPRTGPHELLVKVATCGVCPTDIKKIRFGTVPPPRIFGHETAGTIVRVGSSLRGFRVGDRVALHHHVPCLKCHACRHRSFAQCPQYKRTGITAGFEPAGGGYAEYVRVMRFVLPGVVKIPSRNTFEEGAMLEPVNTVLKGIRRLSLLPNDTVLVVGQGPIGLLFTRLLKLEGQRVVAMDLLPQRAVLAKKFGADKVLLGKTCSVTPQLSRRTGGLRPQQHLGELTTSKVAAFDLLHAAASQDGVLPWLPRTGLDAAIITAPSDDAVQAAHRLVRSGGKILVFAHTRRGACTSVDLSNVCVDEKDLMGSYSADITLQKEVARLAFSRELDVRPLITHRIPLHDGVAAINLAAEPTRSSLKIFVAVSSGMD